MHTYASALALSGIDVPAHLTADAEIPVLTGPQAQGDLLVVPVAAPQHATWTAIPAAGVQLIRGEQTGNTHWLHQGFDSPDVRWAPEADNLRVGHLLVPPGQSALLLHTDEHGANAIGPGTYAIHRKRAVNPTIGRVVEQPTVVFIAD
jgi:hypothetical protein